MDDARNPAPEFGARSEAQHQQAASPPLWEHEGFLQSLDARFHPDRVNAHLWHCRTQEEFDRERDRLWDDEDDLYARPDQDGGNDSWFTDRN